MLRPYEVCWWDDLEACLDTRIPFWVIATRVLKIDARTYAHQDFITGAVMARNEEHAFEQIVEAYNDNEVVIELASIQEQYLGWSPFSRKKPKRSEMIWNQRPH